MGNHMANFAKKKEVSLRRGVYNTIVQFYKQKVNQIIKYCTHPDKHKTALAIASAICIGITPLFGFTFILATVFGIVFRLNQFIMQSLHILVSPLQVLLFYPFMRAGKSLFGLREKIVVNFENLPELIFNHSDEFINHYLKLLLAGITVWILFSFLSGYIIYIYIRWRLGQIKT